MKTRTANFIAVGILIALASAFMFLGYKSYSADKFCRDKGHDGGTYKAIDGGYYSCRDYTKYYIGKTNGED